MSPLHPAPDEEINPATLPTTQLQNDDIDLNPDLYDEEDEGEEDGDKDSSNTKDGSKDQPNGINLSSLNNLASQELQDYESSMAQIQHQANLTTPQLQAIKQITLPFDEAYAQFVTRFNSITSQHSISQEQESKFVSFIDGKLLQIQRRFIKQQSDPTSIYTLPQLVAELDAVVDVIWVSVERKSRLFCQSEYFIKILGDLEDYVAHYKRIFDEIQLDSHSRGKFVDLKWANMEVLFSFWRKVDLMVSLLIDGYDLSEAQVEKMSRTELVRLIPIVSRLRLSIIAKLDRIRVLVVDDAIRDMLELEVSQLFEGVLERS
ncbi:uncharacterized protein LODBEIA_P34640 [Lodderomyces beijingensis]|uniref:Uncharacterized protein n=1 Tax=Lodderomyces beijingensis TaxID=1775926 RepID=A0ABP0ZSP9_9ASCO